MLKIAKVDFKQLDEKIIEKIKDKMEFVTDTYEGHTALEKIWERFNYLHLEWYKVGDFVDIIKIKNHNLFFVWYREKDLLNGITASHTYCDKESESFEKIELDEINDFGLRIYLEFLTRSYDLDYVINEEGEMFLKEGLWNCWELYYKNKRLTIDDIIL